MKFLFRLSIVIFLVSCSSNNKFKIEKEQPLQLKEAYFEQWTSGVKGGGSGLNIFLISEKKGENKDVQIEGIYFQDSYTTLTFYQPNKYQGFIKTKGNDSSFALDEGGKKVDASTKQKEEEIPFELGDNEAVISYVKEGKKKYFKVTMVKKEMKTLPM